ncbi:hypothetical protein BDW68DRAFT_155152 [Aspergillus falconensis]
MHPDMRDWCLPMSESRSEPKAVRLKELAFIAFGHMAQTNDCPNSWMVQQRLLPHVGYVLSRLRTVELTDSIPLRTTFNGIGKLFAGQRKLNQAEEAHGKVGGCGV